MLATESLGPVIYSGAPMTAATIAYVAWTFALPSMPFAQVLILAETAAFLTVESASRHAEEALSMTGPDQSEEFAWNSTASMAQSSTQSARSPGE
jgi:hypothetical protein